MKSITSLFLIFCFTGAFAKEIQIDNKIVDQIYYNNRTNAPAFIKFKLGYEPLLSKAFSWIFTNYSLSNSTTFKLISQHTDELGVQHSKYQQLLDGIPVEFANYSIHSKNGKVLSFSGDLNLDIQLINSKSIVSELAVASALKYVSAKSYLFQLQGYEAEMRKQLNDPNFSVQPNPTLMVYPIGEGMERTFKLVYKMDIWANEPESRQDIYVDAQSGLVIDSYEKLHTSDVKGIAKTKYSGIRTITTDSVAAKDTIPAYYRLKEVNRAGVGFQIETRNLKSGSNASASSDFTDADNYWDNVNVKFDEAATDGHFAAESSYDVFKKVLNRNSWNNQGGKMSIYVHWGNVGTVNAQWNGSYAQFGDGGGNPLTSLDVVGHELGHGITRSSANLAYRSESGALNESYSDIFGSVVEYYTDSANFAWDIGLATFKLRDMSNPNRFGNPDTYGTRGKFWTDTKNCTPNSSNDNCGVHNNSGVQNYWFFLMVTGTKGPQGQDTSFVNDNDSTFSVKGLGFEKASKIAYKSLNEFLNSESNFEDARFFSIQAAVELYGAGSNEVIQTTNAWYGVGVGKKYTFFPDADFKVSGQICGLNQKITFTNTSGSAYTYVWNFGDGDQSDVVNPVHTYVDPGTYSVTLIAQNENGTDTLIKKDLITVFDDCPREPDCAGTTTLPSSRYGILRLNFSNIDNESSDAKTEGGYVNFTGIRANVAPGQVYEMKITTDKYFSVISRAWIDFNDDGVFQSEEKVLSSDSNVHFQTANVFIPENAVQGKSLRLRVNSFKPTSTAKPEDPCATVKNGQIEEYSVLIDKKFLGIIESKNNSDLNIYPNPAKGNCIIDLSNLNKGTYEINVLNAIGSSIKSESLTANSNNQNFKTSINLSDMAEGLYIVKVSGNNYFATKKLLISK